MENEKPLILVSNDDGVMAKGINELVKFLRPLGDIVVMAPDAPRSGSGCALTVTQPVHYQLVKKEVGLTVYKCSGTPTDCIKLARNTVLDRTQMCIRDRSSTTSCSKAAHIEVEPRPISLHTMLATAIGCII